MLGTAASHSLPFRRASCLFMAKSFGQLLYDVRKGFLTHLPLDPLQICQNSGGRRCTEGEKTAFIHQHAIAAGKN